MAYSRFRPPRRVPFLDEMRGLSILLMIFYHGLYDLVYLFGVSLPFHTRLLDGLQLYICGSFILISGIVSRYSKSNLKRGMLVLGTGLAIGLFTLRFMPEQAIYFGVLHLLGSSMILFALLRRALDRLPAAGGILLCVLLFVLTRDIAKGRIGLPYLFSLELPRFLYEAGFLFPLGFMPPGFYSADYFPLFPWLFWFLTGSCIGVFFVRGVVPELVYRSHVPFLAAAGRRSLLIYVLHQPLLYGLLYLILQIAPGFAA